LIQGYKLSALTLSCQISARTADGDLALALHTADSHIGSVL
jgi:hypothetical protein